MKKIGKVLSIIIVVSFIIWIFYRINTVRIEVGINIKNIAVASIGMPSGSVYTEDINDILKIIKYFNRIRYYKGDFHSYNESPDSYIVFLDKEGKVIECIHYYGDIARYNGKTYKMSRFFHTYRGIEELCDRINDKNE